MTKTYSNLTTAQRQHFDYMLDVMEQLEWDLHAPVLSHKRIPAEWYEIAAKRHPKKKVKVTLWVEEDVVRFFKKMGKGYTTRMNDVMVAFMQARLSGLISGTDTKEEFLDPLTLPKRPEFGDFDATLDALKQRDAERAKERDAEG